FLLLPPPEGRTEPRQEPGRAPSPEPPCRNAPFHLPSFSRLFLPPASTGPGTPGSGDCTGSGPFCAEDKTQNRPTVARGPQFLPCPPGKSDRLADLDHQLADILAIEQAVHGDGGVLKPLH